MDLIGIDRHDANLNSDRFVWWFSFWWTIHIQTLVHLQKTTHCEEASQQVLIHIFPFLVDISDLCDILICWSPLCAFAAGCIFCFAHEFRGQTSHHDICIFFLASSFQEKMQIHMNAQQKTCWTNKRPTTSRKKKITWNLQMDVWKMIFLSIGWLF